MFTFSQALITAGFVLMLINLFRCVRHVFFSKDVMLNNGRFQIALTVLVLVMMVGLCVLYGCIYSIYYLSGWIVVLVLAAIVLFSVALSWFFSQLNGMRSRSLEMLESLVGVIEATDPNLDGHSLYVRNLSLLMYHRLPFFTRLSINPNNLHYAALLLDVGKLGVPRSIIDKSGKLEDEEWAIIRRHPEIGVKILQPIQSFDTISTWILYHHERIDGTGYHGIKGTDIPLVSRILAVCDTYSAITMERSYKATRSHDEALAELRLAAGTQLDAELVELFCRIPCPLVEHALADVKQKLERYQEESFRE